MKFNLGELFGTGLSQAPDSARRVRTARFPLAA